MWLAWDPSSYSLAKLLPFPTNKLGAKRSRKIIIHYLAFFGNKASFLFSVDRQFDRQTKRAKKSDDDF